MSTQSDSSSPEYPPELVRAAMDQAVKDVLREVPAADTVARMAGLGLDAGTAAAVYGQVRAAIKTTRQRTAVFLMISGTFWLLACGVGWLVAGQQGRTSGVNRALLLLVAIALVQGVAGYFRWRRARNL